MSSTIRVFTGMTMNLENHPGGVPQENEEPKPGDIYRPKGGPPGFWWIVGISEEDEGSYVYRRAIYLVFNHRGAVTGCGKTTVSYLSERARIGFAPVYHIDPEWT